MAVSEEIILFRHGIAEDAVERGLSDYDRELTGEGERRTRVAALGLSRWHAGPVQLIHSPLRRASQTAAVVADVFQAPLTELSILAPGSDPASVLAELAALDHAAGAPVVVGHQPDLGDLVSHVIAPDRGGARTELKKASACALSMPVSASSCGTLRWLLPPRVLRLLAETPAAGDA